MLGLHTNADSTLYKDPTSEGNVHYYGPEANNYIKVGSEIFRILGVMNNVKQSDGTSTSLLKLTRSSTVASMTFGGNNVWTSSNVLSYLNNTYASTLSSVNSYIANVVWYTGAINTDSTIISVFNQERASTSTYTGKYGLLYASDYGYTTSYMTCYSWILTLPPIPYNHIVGSRWGDFDYPCSPNSWLAKAGNGTAEWIISPYPSNASYHWNIRSDRVIGNYFAVNMNLGVRPTIYLTKTTRIISGNGTSGSPYIIG